MNVVFGNASEIGDALLSSPQVFYSLDSYMIFIIYSAEMNRL